MTQCIRFLRSWWSKQTSCLERSMENYNWPIGNLKAHSPTKHNAIQLSWHHPLWEWATCWSNWQLRELKNRRQNPSRRRYPKGYGKHIRLYHTSQNHVMNHPATTLLPSPCSHNQSRTISSSVQNVKEKISLSASGRQVGHYKAATECPILSALHATMMTIPFQTGHSPWHWQTVVDIMLEKELGALKVPQLQVIQLLESDKNQALRIILARRISHLAEDDNQISDMQYGSWHGKMGISPLLNKVLTYNILCQTKEMGATLDFDALRCFDRIIQCLALLITRQFGVPKQQPTH